MTLDEFEIEISQLQDFYGKEYNFTQKRVFFEELKDFSAEKFRQAIRILEQTSQYKPTLNQILITIRQVRAKYSDNDNKITEYCKLCKGTGYVFYKKRVQTREYEYVCLCNCKNSEGLEYDGNKISDKDQRSKYYIPKLEEVFGDNITNKNIEKPVINKNLFVDLYKQVSL